MGLFDKLLGKEEKVQKPESISVSTEKNTLYLPIQGEIIDLKEIGDGVFSEGILGGGCGIRPTEEYVYAPADGVVSTVADTKHAVGITTDEGAEILIHVGMDTVEMKGDGFNPFVSEGDKVTCGTSLLKFDAGKIKAAGFPTTTAFVVTNDSDLGELEILSTGSNEKLTPFIKIK